MLIKCPNCGKTSENILWEGWVLKVIGSVQFNDLGKLKSVGPLTAVTTISRGEELDQCHESLSICTKCKYKGPLNCFTKIYSCVLTGKEANNTIQTLLGLFRIDDRYLELANFIFNNENALNWRNSNWAVVQEEIN